MEEYRKKVSFVIPVYNEEESLIELHRQIVNNIRKAGNYDYEIIFVNDGSKDNSVQVIRELHEQDDNVHLISFRRNFGKSAAMEAGFRAVSGDIVITMDSDLQDDPAEIPHFLETIAEGYDLVSGWKFNRQDPAEKKLPSKLFNKVTSLMSGIKLHDFNCCYKAYRREVVDAIHVYGELHRYLPVLAYCQGFGNIAEIRVIHNKRQFGHSKYGFKRYFHGFFDCLTINFLLRYGSSPMYFFGKLGLMFCAIGGGMCLYLAVLKLLYGESIGTRPLLTLAVLLLIGGGQMFAIGIIGEMLTDIKKREYYSEDHVGERF